MIKDKKELELSREALLNLETALQSLKEKIEPINKELFIAMSQDYFADISRIRCEIEEYLGFPEIERFSLPIWITLEGRGLTTSNFSLPLLSNWTSKLRKVVQNIIMYTRTYGDILSLPILSKITDFRCVKILPGSIKLGLQTPDIYKDDLFFDKWLEENRPIEKALEILFEYIKHINDFENSDQLIDWINSQSDRNFYLGQLLSLAPSSKSIVSTIKFDGALLPDNKQLSLDRNSRTLIKGIFEKSFEQPILELEGNIREIDLDKRRIILRDVEGYEGDLYCLVPNLLLDTSMKSLSARVKITGTRKNLATPIIIINIEPLITNDTE